MHIVNRSGIPLLVLVIVTTLISIEGYNVDTSYPIIIKNTADGDRSLFGGAVALINEKDPGVIVGSPKSNSSLSSHAGIVEPGKVWQCSFLKTSNPCRVLVMDPTGNVNDPNNINVTDRKDGGWLGGSIAENSNHFVTCASRWSNQYYAAPTSKMQYYMNGMCYWRPKRDVFQDPFPVRSNTSRFLPLIDYEHQRENIWSWGQAGFSVHTPLNTDEVILGAPGVQRWRGSIIKITADSQGPKPESTYIFNNENPDLKIELFSYLGYVVSSGRFFQTTSLQYVAGAPRGKSLRGQVLVFRLPITSKSDVLAELVGTQVGSYFGSSLCVADINADGWDDLIVGAPMHSVDYRRLKTAGIMRGSGDEGTVFVYLSNKGNGFSFPTMINGMQTWSQFGSAIANLGDINSDGFSDIAIGAPYADGGSGVVYIFNGGPGGLLRDKMQEIKGHSFMPSIRGFGYSLSSGKDMDLNGYNDLAVGAFGSGHVVILRTRPLLTAYGSVRTTINKISFDAESFEVQSCLQYTGDSIPEKMEFRVTITSDTLSIPRRVFLQIPEQANPSTEHTYEEEVYRGVESCTKFVAVVKERLELTGKPVEIRQTVLISQTEPQGSPTFYDIRTTFGGGQVSTQVSGPGYHEFCKTCPLLDPNSSKFKELLLPLAVPCGHDDRCDSEMRIEFKFLEKLRNGAFVIGTSNLLTLEVTVTNFGEPAIAAMLKVLWNTRPLKKTPARCQSPSTNETTTEISCPLGRTLESERPVTVAFEFDMKDLEAGSLDRITFHIQASTASESLDPSALVKVVELPLVSEADIFMKGSDTSMRFNLETLSTNTIFYHTYEIGLNGPTPILGASVEFRVPKSLELRSLSKTKFDIGEPMTSVTSPLSIISCVPESGSFRHFSRFTIARNLGTDAIDIYEDEDETAEDTLTEDEETTGVSYDDLTSTLSPGGEIKLGGLLGPGNAQLNVNCDSSKNIVKCMTIRCRITSMKPGFTATIQIPLRMDSDRLRDILKSRFSSVKIVSSGVAEILGVSESIQPIHHKPDGAAAKTLIEEETHKPVSVWIYVLGVFIGLLVLVAIAYCLYRMGLFDRKKPEPVTEESHPLQGDGNNQDAKEIK